jgi:CheY-like chemotaxis protein
MAVKKKLAIGLTMTSELPRIFLGDAPRLRQILINLLGNAVKFTKEGRITVAVDGKPVQDNRYELEFVVRDTGIGIPPAEQSRLFQPFSQIQKTVMPHGGGTGLGLIISQRLAELMKGRMWVESTGIPGEGAAFHFTISAERSPIPATVHDTLPKIQGTSSEKPPSEAGELTTTNLRVLLVEDSVVNQKVTGKMLDRLQCKSSFASNGCEAVDVIEVSDYDVILMDCQMPEMDGYEATRRIRLREEHKHLKPVWIIAMTAAAMQGDREECIAAGMDDYLSKPVRLTELQQALNKYLSLHRNYEDDWKSLTTDVPEGRRVDSP